MLKRKILSGGQTVKKGGRNRYLFWMVCNFRVWYSLPSFEVV